MATHLSAQSSRGSSSRRGKELPHRRSERRQVQRLPRRRRPWVAGTASELPLLNVRVLAIVMALSLKYIPVYTNAYSGLTRVYLSRPLRPDAQKDRARDRAGPSRRPEAARALVRRPTRTRSQRLVFIDETWASTNMARLPRPLPARRAASGRRARRATGRPRPSSARLDLVAASSRRWVLDGPINRDRLRDLCRPRCSCPGTASPVTSSSWTTCPATRDRASAS